MGHQRHDESLDIDIHEGVRTPTPSMSEMCLSGSVCSRGLSGSVCSRGLSGSVCRFE